MIIADKTILMKQLIIYIGLFFLCSFSLMGQSISELETQLTNAEGLKEKVRIGMELAEKNMIKNPEVAAVQIVEVYNNAVRLKDISSMASIAYLDGKIQLRRSENTKAAARFKTALKLAKENEDIAFAVRCLNKLIDISKRKKNYREALTYSQESIALLKEKIERANNSNHLGKRFAAQQAKLKTEIDQLEKENTALEEKILSLKDTGTPLSLDTNKLANTKKTLELHQEESLQKINEKDVIIADASPIKKHQDARTEKQKIALDTLSKEAMKESLLLQEKELELAKTEIQKAQHRKWIYLLLGIATVIILLSLLYYFQLLARKRALKIVEEKNKIIEEERKRSEELVLHIFPEAVAQELKENGKVIARKHEYASVLFADFKNFTKIAQQLSPEKLVKELDHCFQAFDKIIEKYKSIEKIKTIGDSYLCASGLTTIETLPNELIQAALEMQDFLYEYRVQKIARSEAYFQARIGIHTGAVVAGVVGLNKLAYDIWGDTLNIAAMMEANCQEGKVNISEETYRLVKYNFDCMYHGKIATKYKSEIDMYYVQQEMN